MSLERKVAVVTGAGSGIGRACAVALGWAGATVVANDLVEDGLQERIAQVGAAGETALAAVGDARRPDDVEDLVGQARSSFGGLDVMVANAAVSAYIWFERMTEEQIDLVLETNLRCAAPLRAGCNPPHARARRREHRLRLFGASVRDAPRLRPLRAAKSGLVAAARALRPRSVPTEYA